MPETGNNTAIEAKLNLIDETFDISQAGSYHLSIQIGVNGLSFCVFNTVINKYIVLRDYPLLTGGDMLFACNNIFENDDMLGLRYKSCGFMEISPRCTLFPEHLFDPGYAAAYLSFNHGWKGEEFTSYNCLHPIQLYNVFSLSEELKALLKKYQPNISFYHHATPFVNWMVSRSYATSKPLVAVYYYDDYMDILVTQDKKLLLYNTFHIKTPEDSIYYLAGVLNLFDLQLASTAISYVGDPKDSLANMEIIKRYVSRISECEPIDTVTYSHYLTESIRKRYTHLFNLQGCAS